MMLGTWILIAFGLITCLPLLISQLIFLANPKGRKAKDILIGKGEEWRDASHFKTAYGLAVADWMLFFPVFAAGTIGLVMDKDWGYLLYSISGVLQIYINIFLWYFERAYVYPKLGPVRYYTYYWGNFMYWGTAAFVYGVLKITGIFS